MNEDQERRRANEYETQPRRRRDDDLTLNEWRLLKLEKKADNCVQTTDFERVRMDVEQLSHKVDDSEREVNARIDTAREGLNAKLDNLKTWIVATAISICAVVLTATGLSIALHR